MFHSNYVLTDKITPICNSPPHMETLGNSFISSPPQQERHILLTKNPTSAASETMLSSSSFASSSSPPEDVTIKINGRALPNSNNATISRNSDETATGWTDLSYDLSNDPVTRPAASSNAFDFVTETPASQTSPLSRIPETPNTKYDQLTPRDVRVSFHESTVSNRHSNTETDEVLVCNSNGSFQRKSTLLRNKTKSRLLDAPMMNNSKSKTPRMVKSRVMGFDTSEIDEDDPLMEEDLPEHYKKTKFSAFSYLQLVSLILIIAALACSLTINVLKRRTVFGLELWKWELMVLVLISGKLVSGWGIRIAVFFIERNFLLRKRVLYFVYGLRNAVQNCIWLALVLIAWQCIFDQKVERVTHGKILPYVTKIWVCLLVGMLIWLVKTLLVKVLASSFHVSAFFDRIQESLFNQYVIETLSGPPLVEIQQEIQEEKRAMVEVQKLQSVPADLNKANNIFPESGRVIGITPRKSKVSAVAKSPAFSRVSSEKEVNYGITIDHLHRLNQRNISAWNMTRMMNIVRKGMISTLDEKLQKDSTDEDEAVVQITNEDQAKAVSKNIFVSVAKPASKYIYEEDLLRFMPGDEVSRTIRLFEGASDQKGISQRALTNWVVNAFRERRALALSLNDTKTAVNMLHQLLNMLVGIVIVVIWLLILRVATTHFFIFLSSQFVLVAFTFGNTCKTIFEAIIFLFVMHPFDVGDRVEIDGVQMVVEEMNILTTVFLKFDNHKIYYPNSVLSTKPINNYYRSPDMLETIDFCLHISSPMEKIAIMKERITNYCNQKNEHWYPDPRIVMTDVEDMNRLKWTVWPTQKLNFQDMAERWDRRSLLIEEMIKIFRELDLEYRLLPLDVNVHNMPPITSTRLLSNWTAGAAA